MRRPVRLLISLACVLTLATGARASAAATQPAPTAGAQDVSTQQTAMQRLHFMVGSWVGSGWNLTPTGVRQDFRQADHVRYQVSGLAISVEGEGRDPADPHRVVDSALAVINFNDVTNQYRWEAFSQGFITVATPVVGNDTFQWSLVTSGPTIRYSLRFTATTWHEIGEVSADGGTTWHQTFQMDLVRRR